jgi:uncharacterized membrane protein YdjX (TVP38/TMEM64 family)
MAEVPGSERKKLLLKLAAVAVVGAVLAVAALLGLDVRALIEQGLAMIRNAGPVAFFTCMTLAPCFGFPMLGFMLTAMASFGERLGPGTVMALALSAATANMVISYSLARWLLRPFIRRIVERLGFRLPEVQGSDATDMLIILRVTPGIPFFVQNYMAGLADMPLPRYLLLSCLISHSYNVAFILFGDALLHGKGKIVLIVVGVIAALVAATHMLRRHYASKTAKA